mmetsp:Transcript_995/g.1917  ORF Transcript_995/g.1917 Transcript_995/m.1917 type:complete len:448 (+) Transcript_995:921-2264(+)
MVFAIVRVEVFFDGLGLRQRLLDHAKQRQDDEEIREPVGGPDQGDVGIDPLGRARAHPHQYHEVDGEDPEPPFEHRAVATGAHAGGIQPGRQCHHEDRTEHRDHAEEFRVDDAAGQEVRRDHDPDFTIEGPQDRVERQEVPFRNDMRRGHQRVRLDVVVGVAEVVRHEAHDREEDHQDHRQGEEVLDHEVRPERQRVLLGFRLGGAAHFDARGVVVARRVEGPDVNQHEAKDQEGQQVMQRQEAVQRGVVHGRSAQKPGLDAFADERDGAEEAGDHGRAPEGHLAPGQNVAHERRAHHQHVDQHADDPCHFAGRLVGAVVEAAEDVQVDRHEEQRGAVHVDVADRPAAVHVAHDVLDRGEGHVDVRRVVHHQQNAGEDLHDEAEDQHDAEDPHPVEVLRSRDHQRVVHQADNRQAAVKPLLAARIRFVMVVGNSTHGFNPPLTEQNG